MGSVISHLSLFVKGFNKELKKTVAYVTQLMEEEEGEAVKWEILRGDLQSKGHPYSDFFGIVGKSR